MESLRTIGRIAKTELRTLFYSPIAWFLIIILLVQSAGTFVGNVDQIVRMQEFGAKWDSSVTSMIFASNRGVFGQLLQSFYLYLPLLTMGLISRETSSGTIKLLYSSPVRVREIVLGKFFSMLVMILLMMAVIGLLVVSTYFMVESPDTGKFLSALLGIFLLLGAYAAIGLFMSCLTTYQVIAAVCTFVTFYLLEKVGSFGQGVPFIRDITYFFSISGRTGKMLNGLITSKDVLYFVLIMYLFTGLSILKLKSGMESKPALVKWGRYLTLIASTLVIGVVSAIPSFVLYFDVTRTKENTIVPAAQKMIRELGDEPLEVTGYANILGGYWEFGAPQSYYRNLGRWEPYMRFNPHIQLKTVRYYDTLNLTEKLEKIYRGWSLKKVVDNVAENYNVNPSSLIGPDKIRNLVDLGNEPPWYIMQLKYKGRTTMLRVFEDNDVWPSEREVVAALKRLVIEKMPKILFATSDLERSIHKIGDREYKALANLNTFRYSLVNQGFDVDTLTLEQRPVPAGTAALVIADPKTALSAAALSNLQQYVDAGGNLFISVEPGKQHLLNPFFQQFGVHVLDGTLVQKSRELQPDLVTPLLTETAAKLFPMLEHAHHAGARVSMPSATALSFSDTGSYTIKTLLETDPASSWLKKGTLVTDSAEVFFTPEDGDMKGRFPTAVQVTRKRPSGEQRIIIASDADFMANTELQRTNVRTANFAFTTGLFSWLNYGAFPIDISRPPVKDLKVTISRETIGVLKIVYVWVLPALMVLFGTILLIRRKRK